MIARCKETQKVFGGYTDLLWDALEEGKHEKGNGNSFIFSVRDKN
jgi:hypothetical protein